MDRSQAEIFFEEDESSSEVWAVFEEAGSPEFSSAGLDVSKMGSISIIDVSVGVRPISVGVHVTGAALRVS